MLSGIYSFSQILEDVKQETGITNMRNLYPTIRKLIARAEKEINPYAGFLIRKRMIFYVGNGNFDGTSFKKPKDYVQLDKVGPSNEELPQGTYFENVSHIVICDGKERKEIIFTYWAIQCDEEGNPVTTYNHSEAVVSYIVWKLYSPKTFMGEGNYNIKKDYEQAFELRAQEARGEDFFPSEESLNAMKRNDNLSQKEIYERTNYQDGCISSNCLYPIQEDSPPVEAEENTAPTVQDNCTPIVREHLFTFANFTKEYNDEENHLPKKFLIYGDVDNEIGKLYYDKIPLSKKQLPLEFFVYDVEKLTFKLNYNIEIDGSDLIIYEELENLEFTIKDNLSEGYTYEKVGDDIVFSKGEDFVIENKINIYVVFDTVSIKEVDGVAIKKVLQDWIDDYKENNIDYKGELYVIPIKMENWIAAGSGPWTGSFGEITEKGLWEDITQLPPDINSSNWIPQTNAIVLSFIGNTASSSPHSYIRSYLEFKNIFENNYDFFKAFLFPISKNANEISSPNSITLQSIAAIEGKRLSRGQIDTYKTEADIEILLTENLYQDYILEE